MLPSRTGTSLAEQPAAVPGTGRTGRAICTGQLLPAHRLPEQGIYAVYPDTGYVPAKVRRFVDFVRGYVAR